MVKPPVAESIVVTGESTFSGTVEALMLMVSEKVPQPQKFFARTLIKYECPASIAVVAVYSVCIKLLE
jgi:hypothetical protein